LIRFWLIGFTPHIGLRCALHQPTPAPTRIKAPINLQTGLGPTLAKSYPIDGRGRHESPAVIRPDRG